MKKAYLSVIISFILLTLLGCNSDEDKITVQDGKYDMEHEDSDEILVPSVKIINIIDTNKL